MVDWKPWHFMWWVSMVGNLVFNVVVNVGGHRWEWLPKEWRCPYVRWTRKCKKWCERCLRMFVQLSPLALIESGVTCGALVPALRKLNSRFDWSLIFSVVGFENNCQQLMMWLWVINWLLQILFCFLKVVQHFFLSGVGVEFWTSGPREFPWVGGDNEWMG